MFDECIYDSRVECEPRCRHSLHAPTHEPLSACGMVCRRNMSQDIADYGPGPVSRAAALVQEECDTETTDGYAPPPSTYHGDEFGAAASRTLDEVRAVFTARGNTYGDTWAVGPVWGPSTPQERLTDCATLINVKVRRSLSAAHAHRDSLIDLIAYAAAYVTWMDDAGAWR